MSLFGELPTHIDEGIPQWWAGARNTCDLAVEVRPIAITGLCKLMVQKWDQWDFEWNVRFGLLFGCDPSSGASLATISRVMPLTLAFPLLFAGGAGEGAD